MKKEYEFIKCSKVRTLVRSRIEGGVPNKGNL